MKKLLSSLAVVTLIGVTSISVVTCGGERPSPVEKTFNFQKKSWYYF
ncbi:hypothetical protein [Spiroplasma endosymbiont of Zeiraphera isertana]